MVLTELKSSISRKAFPLDILGDNLVLPLSVLVDRCVFGIGIPSPPPNSTAEMFHAQSFSNSGILSTSALPTLENLRDNVGSTQTIQDDLPASSLPEK